MDGSGYVNNWSAPAEDDDDDGFYADAILRNAGIYVAPYVEPYVDDGASSVRRGTPPPALHSVVVYRNRESGPTVPA